MIFCQKPHVKILKWRIFANFWSSGSFNNTAQNGYFCWFEAKYLKNGSKYCPDFWYQVKTWWEELNYQAILSEKVWIIQKWSWIIQKFQKNETFSKIFFSNWMILRRKKVKKTMKIFFLTKLVWHLVILAEIWEF